MLRHCEEPATISGDMNRVPVSLGDVGSDERRDVGHGIDRAQLGL
jgi:hypothetical protein